MPTYIIKHICFQDILKNRKIEKIVNAYFWFYYLYKIHNSYLVILGVLDFLFLYIILDNRRAAIYKYMKNINKQIKTPPLLCLGPPLLLRTRPPLCAPGEESRSTNSAGLR